MSVRFVKVTTFYRDYLRLYYQKNPFLLSQSYEEQYAHLMDQGYGWADFYARNLRKLGIDAHEIVFNAQPLQRAWAQEHGIEGSEKGILEAQLQSLKPEVVLFQDSFKLNGSWITNLRAKIPSLRYIMGYCCAPFSQENIEQFRAFDSLMVCSPLFYERFSRSGLKVHLVYHAFEPSLLPRLKTSNKYPSADVIFTGSLIPGSDFHPTRQKILEHLLDANLKMDIYANIVTIGTVELLGRQGGYLTAAFLKRIGLRSLVQSLPLLKKVGALNELPRNPTGIGRIRKAAKPPLFGLDMLRALSQSRIGLNVHGDVAGEYAANVRMFEVTGVGSCLVTDLKRNMSELFEVDAEVVTFKSAAECLEKIRWLLDHGKERKEIAQRGQRRTLKDHTFAKRSEQLAEIIFSSLRRGRT